MPQCVFHLKTSQYFTNEMFNPFIHSTIKIPKQFTMIGESGGLDCRKPRHYGFSLSCPNQAYKPNNQENEQFEIHDDETVIKLTKSHGV